MRISVGICSYNGERFIREQLESIINQTMQPDEIILSDDCSSDNTLQVALDVLKASNIKYQIISHKEHQGIKKNFGNAFDACTGDVIFSCDQDDIWLPQKIEKFIPYFEAGNCFVYSNSVVIDQDGNLQNDNYWSMYNIDFSKVSVDQFRYITLTNRTLSGYNMAFTKAFYQKIRPFPKHYVFDDWIAICSSWFGPIAFIDQPLTKYRVHGKNTSGFSISQDSEGRKRKNNLLPMIQLNVYRTARPDQWFGDTHLYLAAKVFYNRMHQSIDDNYRKKVKRYIIFSSVILSCLPQNRLQSIRLITKELISGRYREFRGGVKSFVKDVIYLAINKNTEFNHNYDVW